MVSAAKRATGNVRQYIGIYWWLLADLRRQDRWRPLLTVLLSLTGVVVQGLAMGIVLLYVYGRTGQGAGESTQFSFLGDTLDLPVSGSTAGLLAWGGAALLAAVTGAAIAYASEALTLTIARDYVYASITRLLDDLAAGRLRDIAGVDPHERRRHLERIIGGDASHILRAIVVVFGSARLLMMALGGLALLAWINPPLTLGLFAVALCFAVPYYLVNRGVIADAHGLERSFPDSKRAATGLLGFVLGRLDSAPSRRIAPLYERNAAIRRRHRHLRGVLLARQRATLVLTLFVSVALVTTLTVFAVFVADDQTSWVGFLTYVATFAIIGGSVSGLGSSITATNRHLPSVKRYVELVRDAPPATNGLGPRARTPLQPRVVTELPPIRRTRRGGFSLPESQSTLTWDGQQRVFCVSPSVPDILSLDDFYRRLVGPDETAVRTLTAETFLCGKAATLPPISVAALTGVESLSAQHRRRIKDVLAELGLAREFAGLSDGFKTKLTPEVERKISRPLRVSLALMEGILSDRRVFVLDWRPLSGLDKDFRSALFGVLDDRQVLLVSNSPGNATPRDIHRAVVMDDRGVVGIGDAAWYSRVAPVVAKAWGATANGGIGTDLADELDELDEE